jgi:hypothetical protein
VNPALAPRSTLCLVCKEVADLADVALRLWFEDGERIPAGVRRAGEYLASIGIKGSKRALEARAETHRDHAERYANGEASNVRIVPFPGAPPAAAGDVVIPSTLGPARWLDVQQDAMDIGRDAIARLAEKVRTGALDPKELVSVAKMGTAAAGKRADLEAKGRKLNQMDELLQLAAGLSGQRQLPSGEA